MKKELTKEYVSSNRGCYSREQVESLSFMKKDKFDINKVIKSEIPLKDKFWFVVKKCELTVRQNQDMAIGVAEIVLSIYEAKCPDNKAPREAIQAAKDFINGLITIDILRQKRSAYAAYAAYADADADADAADAAYAAYAAYTAYTAAYTAAYATYTAAAYATYAAAAADAAKTKQGSYTKLLLKFLLEFIKNN